jgi:hypothetical protein
MVRSGVPLGGDTDIYAGDDVALAGTPTGKGTGIGGALSGGTDDDTDVVVAKTREQKIDDLVASGVDRTLAEASIDSLEGGVNVDDGTSAAELRDTLVEQVMSTQPTASELYLSAMGKVGSGISDFSPEEQRALYGVLVVRFLMLLRLRICRVC